MFQILMGKVAKVLIPSKNKHQMLKQMMEEKEIGKKIKELRSAKENAKEVRFEDNLDYDESMSKRKAQSDGESEAGGSKRSRSEKSGGGAAYDSPTNKQITRGGRPYEAGFFGPAGGNSRENSGKGAIPFLEQPMNVRKDLRFL